VTTSGPAEVEGAVYTAPEDSGTSRVIVPAIDGFRGLAAMAVVLCHVSVGSGAPPLGSGLLRSIFTSGYMGVDFFFVISGFVLFLPTVVAGGRFGNVRSYGLRRFARIVPTYYAALATVVLVLPLVSSAPLYLPKTTKGALSSIVLHLTFLQHSVGRLRLYEEGFGVLAVIWTLTVEVSFYVLLPIIAARYFRHPFVGFGVAVVAAQLWKVAVFHAAFAVDWLPGTASTPLLRLIHITQLPTYFAQFAAGMTAAWLFVRWRNLERPWLPWVTVTVQVAAVVGIAGWMRTAGLADLAQTAGPYDHLTTTLPVALLFAALVVATALGPRSAQLLVTNRAARRLGDVSYGIYLWHAVVVWYALSTLHFQPEGTTGAFLRLLIVTFGASYLLASASYAGIEKPAIRWARRRSRRIEAAGATPPAPGDVALTLPAPS
jgi:peptidoglycan/LPS O-acetylase OafA/YrhL